MDADFIGLPTGQLSGRGAKGRRQRVGLPSLRLRVSERRLLLLTLDVAVVNAALLIALTTRSDFILTGVIALAFYKWFIALTLVWLGSAFIFDAYNLARAASTFNTVRSSGMAALATVLIYTLIPWWTPSLDKRIPLFVFAGAAWLGIVGWRVVYARFFVQPWFKQRALVVGAGWAGRTLAHALSVAPNDANPFRGTGYDLVGFIDDDPKLAGASIEEVPVLGGRQVLAPMAKALQVDEVILAITHRHAIQEELFDALLQCRELGIRVTTMSTIYERLLGRVPVEHVGRDLSMALPMQDTATERFFGVVKRLIDLALALAGLVVLALAVPLLALGNALTSPGPLFYRQERVGRGGRRFQVVKFRSMVPDAEKTTGAVWASAHDQRITPLGRLLRKTRLDELPQVVNVLRGEMSIIGPRPERPEFVEELARAIPFYRARHAVRPGITGWAQVQYRYGNSTDDARIKLEYDLYYVKHASLLLDLRIMLLTIQVMLQFRGT